MFHLPTFGKFVITDFVKTFDSAVQKAEVNMATYPNKSNAKSFMAATTAPPTMRNTETCTLKLGCCLRI